MAKKKKGPEEKPPNLWLASMADLFTILFAMFVMLFALSDTDEELWAEFVMAWQGSQAVSILDFGGEGISDLLGHGVLDMPAIDMSLFQMTPGGLGPAGQGLGGPSAYDIMAERLQTYFGETAFAETIEVEVLEDDAGILISFFDGMLFDSGSSFIRPETFPLLQAVAQEIANFPELNIVIEGHTDNVPISTAAYTNNWWLSTARASRILDYFYNGPYNIDPRRLRSHGLGEYSPIADNLTEAGRQQNRRVEIRLYQP